MSRYWILWKNWKVVAGLRILNLGSSKNFSTDTSIYDYYNSVSRGVEEFCGYKGRVDIINSTLGKALGGAAGINNCKRNLSCFAR